jgi:hypothetical protein
MLTPTDNRGAIKFVDSSNRAVGNTASAVYEAAAPPGDDPKALKKLLTDQVRRVGVFGAFLI